MKSYPRWKYHATQEPTLVASEAEETALGAGWAESPAEVEVPAPTVEPAPIPDPPKPKFGRRK